jgi:hypothetical protein
VVVVVVVLTVVLATVVVVVVVVVVPAVVTVVVWIKVPVGDTIVHKHPVQSHPCASRSPHEKSVNSSQLTPPALHVLGHDKLGVMVTPWVFVPPDAAMAVVVVIAGVHVAGGLQNSL